MQNAHHPSHRLELGAIALGGALGALARVGLSRAFPVPAGSWPWVTFAINLTGAFVLGCIVAHLYARPPRSPLHHPLLTTGLCGTFTTFSTVQVEALQMIDRHRAGLAAGYVSASVAGGLLLMLLAPALVRRAHAFTWRGVAWREVSGQEEA